jgi:hypothetical protein
MKRSLFLLGLLWVSCREMPLCAQEITTDPKLKTPISADLKRPSARQVVELVATRTGVNLTLDPKVVTDRPAFGSLSLRNVPAHKVMKDLRDALVSEGQWEPTADGYALAGLPKRPVAAPVSATERPVVETASLYQSAYLQVAVLVALVLLYFRRRAPRPVPSPARPS